MKKTSHNAFKKIKSIKMSDYWVTVNEWENKITYFKIGVKYFGTILSLQSQFQAFR